MDTPPIWGALEKTIQNHRQQSGLFVTLIGQTERHFNYLKTFKLF
jgi:hypothetical protein